jgi:hypothetical protein
MTFSLKYYLPVTKKKKKLSTVAFVAQTTLILPVLPILANFGWLSAQLK